MAHLCTGVFSVTRAAKSENSRRFIIPVVILALAHLVVAAALYVTLRTNARFSVPFMATWQVHMPFDWLYLFSAWDTGWYVGLASSWYPSNFALQWGFFPLYPITIRGLALLGADLWLSAFLVATTCGLLSIPLFQGIAEHYMDRTMAMNATLTYFLLPWLFVFTAASYSEPLFLFLTTLTWYFHLRRHDTLSSISAALASLTRGYGIFILLPLVFDFTRRREYRKLLYTIPAILAVTAWLTYATVSTGKFLAPLAAESFQQTGNSVALQTNLSQLLLGNLNAISNLSPYFKIIVGGTAFICFISFLSARAYKCDPDLGLYALISTGLITVLAINPAYLSVPRYLTFLFPIGLPLHSSRKIILIVALVLLPILDYVAWYAFLTNIFVFH
jgi:Gpi18-like mannosyltransferase